MAQTVRFLDNHDKDELEQQIDERAKLTDVSSPYNFKGNATVATLPTSGNEINDTYYCTDEKCKYTWNGTAWYQSSLNESDYEEELDKLSEENEQLNKQLSEDIERESILRNKAIEQERNRAVARENEIEGLFSLPTQEAVTKWLDEHPEATTTVQDKSLTIDKMVVGTLGYVTPEMFGAKGDGMTDDTVAIQAAVDSGVSSIYFGNKTYLVSEHIAIPSNVYLRGDATTIHKKSTDETSRLFSIERVENVVIDGFNLTTTLDSVIIDNNMPADTNGWSNILSIRIHQSSGITIKNVHASDGVHSCLIIESDKITVENCCFDGETLYGTYIQDGTDIVFFNTEFCASSRGDIHHHDVYIHQGCENIKFIKCNFKCKAGVSFKNGDDDETTDYPKNVLVKDCLFDVKCSVLHCSGKGSIELDGCLIRTDINSKTSYVFNGYTGGTIKAHNCIVDCKIPHYIISANSHATYEIFNMRAKNCYKILNGGAKDGMLNVSICGSSFDCIVDTESSIAASLYFNSASLGGEIYIVGNSFNNVGNTGNHGLLRIDNQNYQVVKVYDNIFETDTTASFGVRSVNVNSKFYNNLAVNFKNFQYSESQGAYVGNESVGAE